MIAKVSRPKAGVAAALRLLLSGVIRCTDPQESVSLFQGLFDIGCVYADEGPEGGG